MNQEANKLAQNLQSAVETEVSNANPSIVSSPSSRKELDKIIGKAYLPEGFWWISGIEGTTIPQIGADEFEWIQHYWFYDQDLTMIRQELGVKWVRLVFPWYKVNPEANQYDWDWMDRVVERAAQLDFEIILDPIHFGTPLWMKDSFAYPDFPQYAAEYFTQIARRYGKMEAVKLFVPHNEPTITAMSSALTGDWPPYWKSQSRCYQLQVQLALQMVLVQKAVAAEIADPLFIHIDAVDALAIKEPHQASERLLEQLALMSERRFLPYDLISGRVGTGHRFTEELLASGVKEQDLEWLQANGCPLELLGLDYYNHSEGWLSESEDGQVQQEREAHGKATLTLFEQGCSGNEVNEKAPRPMGMCRLYQQYYQRYQCPLVLTETNYGGSVAERQAWLGYTLDQTAQLRQAGMPLLGYTWWGATDHCNWGQGLKERHHIHPVGLWSLVPQSDGTMQRVPTSLVATFRHYLENSATTVGTVACSDQ